MAMILKRRHSLVSLKVMLDADSAEPRIRLSVELAENRVLRTAADWSYSPAELGIPPRLGREHALGAAIPLRFPDAMMAELSELLEYEIKTSALWLHLVKPYAHLGAAPWEQVLTRALHLPVLRLPDFLVPPALESPRTLDVALCVSEPMAKSPFDGLDFILRMVKRVAGAVRRERVTVHVFTDTAHYHGLADAFPDAARGRVQVSSGWGPVWLQLHDPKRAAAYAQLQPDPTVRDQPGRIDNPWLLWMRDEMRGRCLDVVHFSCHGYYALDRGSVALAASPVRNEDAEWARFVGAAELETFLTQTGAWAAAFSSPLGNFSDVGLRYLADDLANRKPFATLYHDIAADPGCADLTEAYAFLFDPVPVPSPPEMVSVSLYCQPSRVTGDIPEKTPLRAPAPAAKKPTHPHKPVKNGGASGGAYLGTADDDAGGSSAGGASEVDDLERTSPPSQGDPREAVERDPVQQSIDAETTLADIFSRAQAVPTWLAAAQRFVEGHAWQVRQWNAAPGAGEQRSELEVTRQTLGEIQQVIAKHAVAAQARKEGL